MERYLEEFYNKLKRHEGSLVRTCTIKKINRNAKEYLNKLSKKGFIDKVSWGWYYIKPKKEKQNALEFLQHDRNFKIITGQSAASFWNHDFIHREILKITVADRSFKKALKSFAKSKGWLLDMSYKKDLNKSMSVKIGNLFIENPDNTIIECIKNWAFADAAAILATNKKTDWSGLAKNSYWTRISGTDIRVRQVIVYMACKLNKINAREPNTRKWIFSKKSTSVVDKVYTLSAIKNDFVRKELDEAIEKVLEFE